MNDHLAALAKGTLPNGRRCLRRAVGVVVVPVGFVSDHMEVVHDLDVEAAQTAASLGLPFARAKAPGPTPRFAADGPRARRGADREPLASARPGSNAAPPTAAATDRRGPPGLTGGASFPRIVSTVLPRMRLRATVTGGRHERPDRRDGLVELRVAVSAAREAGDLLADRAGQVEVAATKSSPTDVVTEMDRRSEELIRSRMLAARPSDAILGEEGGLIGNTDDAPVLWVIDPLDGTVNYLYGLHDWAVSIAAEVGGGGGGAEGGEAGGVEGGEVGRKIVAGAVYVPMRDELF